MIYVIATIELQPGTREAFLAEFRRVVPKVKAEKGCIEYGPAVDVKTDISSQLPPRENAVTIVEKWASLTHLKAHLAEPHMAEYRKSVRPYVAKVSLQVLQPA